MGRYKETWVFNGNTYSVGNSLDEDWADNNIYPLVWFEGRLYNAMIKPESKGRLDRICLTDYYRGLEKKPYWTTVDKVFQILKINGVNNETLEMGKW